MRVCANIKKVKTAAKRSVAAAMSAFVLMATTSVSALDGVTPEDDYEFPYYYYDDVNTGNYESFDWDKDGTNETYYYDSQNVGYLCENSYNDYYVFDIFNPNHRVGGQLYRRADLAKYDFIKTNNTGHFIIFF